MSNKITIEKCPCGQPGCRDWHLVGIGKFVQGSGFEKEEAERIAALLNSHYTPPVPKGYVLERGHGGMAEIVVTAPDGTRDIIYPDEPAHWFVSQFAPQQETDRER